MTSMFEIPIRVFCTECSVAGSNPAVPTTNKYYEI
jgi:hypothetical protein